MGGVRERVIRSVRKVIRCLIKEQLVSGEALRKLMTEMECILNGRPLIPSSDSPADLEALTPNHLLLFRPNNIMPPGVFSKDDMYCGLRWRQIQYLSNAFWKRGLSEYLPTLQERQKWTEPSHNFATGDLVFVVDEKVHRGQWPLGRIVQAHPGKDGVVRCAKIAKIATR